MAQHLTDAIIKRLPAPERANKITYDDDVAGFGARITAGGAKSFVLNYRTKAGRERRITIGSWPDWRTTQARDEARRLKQRIDQGGDPLADIEDERGAPTVAELCDRFEAEHIPRKRPNTADQYRIMIRVYIRPHFGERKVADVTYADVDRLHRKITAQGYSYRANRVVAVLSKMFSLAVRWHMRSDNPCLGIERNHEDKRRRYLSPDELERLTSALATFEDRQAANIFRMLLLTGARKAEALGMRWADIDLGAGVWNKPAAITKQKQHHRAPLSAPARQLLSNIRAEQPAESPYVFAGRGPRGHRVSINGDWRRLCESAKIVGLRIHDLRHSFAAQLASGGASLPLIGAILGHSNPSTTHRYAHLADDPQRAAVERVGAVFEAAGNTPRAGVVPLKGGRNA